jgi:hypothetical protein
MILSNETLLVLRNFATINPGLEFKQGSKISTISPGKSVLAQAVLKDEFPQEFCVYDLNQFLSVHSLFKEAVNLSFDSSSVTFKGDRSRITFRTAEKRTIVTPPEKTIKFDKVDCSFNMTSQMYDELMKTAKVLSSPNIGITSDGETIELVAFDAKNDGKHSNSIVVGEGNGKVYKIVFSTENIKMLQGSYDVEITFQGLAHFKNTKDDIQYWVAFNSNESKV